MRADEMVPGADGLVRVDFGGSPDGQRVAWFFGPSPTRTPTARFGRKETSRRRRSIVPISPMIAAPRLSSLDTAISWVVDGTGCLAAETAPLLSAYSRVLAEEINAAYLIPMTDRAAVDGCAVAAGTTIGASSYNPLPLPLRPISAGEPMPPDTDAVIPLDLGQAQAPDVVECVDAVAPGENVAMRDSVAAAGALLVDEI